MREFLDTLAVAPDTYRDVYVAVLRYAVPILIGILLFRCCKSLVTFRREPEIWGWIKSGENKRVPITHWENVIGRSKSSDILIDKPTVSRNHAVLTRYDDGSWTVTDAGSKAGTLVNGEKIQIRAIREGDVITIADTRLELIPITPDQEQKQAKLRTKASGILPGLIDLMLLTILQCLACIGFLLMGDKNHSAEILRGFGGIALCQWALFLFYVVIRRSSFEIETLAFFLCTMGMAAIATVKPGEAGKQLMAMIIGLGVFLVLGWSLRDLERAKKVRYLAVAAGLGFLVITLLFGTTYYGAKNWLVLGGMTLQPSELSKVCFVYAGASAMDRIMTKRNLFFFILYSVVICGLLVKIAIL